MPEPLPDALRALHLIIMPTEKCNFRCTYCYEDFTVGRMPAHVVSGIKALLSTRKDDLTALKISWFGGEPLLQLPIVFDISRHAQALASGAFPYSANMTTNGFRLDREALRQLVEVGVDSFQISIDGPRQVHDESRLQANGGGTFDQIWRNLLSYRGCDLDFQILLRVHYTAETYRSLPQLIDRFAREFGGDARFKLIFRPITQLGGSRDSEITRLDYAQRREIESFLRGFVPAGNDANLAVEPGQYICYAASPASLVIRADGAVSKCTVALYSDFNKIGRIDANGCLDIDGEKYFDWVKHFFSEDSRFQACPLKAFHAAGPASAKAAAQGASA